MMTRVWNACKKPYLWLLLLIGLCFLIIPWRDGIDAERLLASLVGRGVKYQKWESGDPNGLIVTTIQFRGGPESLSEEFKSILGGQNVLVIDGWQMKRIRPLAGNDIGVHYEARSRLPARIGWRTGYLNLVKIGGDEYQLSFIDSGTRYGK